MLRAPARGILGRSVESFFAKLKNLKPVGGKRSSIGARRRCLEIGKVRFPKEEKIRNLLDQAASTVKF